MNRIFRALGRQDWTSVAIELVVVVAGILIALQVDQWAQGRQQRDLERTYLLRLKEDLQIEYARVSDAEGWARDRLEAVELLSRIAADPAAAARNPMAVPWAIETASWRSFPKTGGFVYNELQNTGHMTLIRSVALRRQLSEHYAHLARDAWVGEDRSAEQSFDDATAGLLSMQELTALERAAGERRAVPIDQTRALALASGLATRPDAVGQLPSVAQHHLFNLRVIGDMKARIRAITATVEREIGPAQRPFATNNAQ